MSTIKKASITRTFFAIDIGNGQSLFQRAWRIMNLEGPLCPLPDPTLNTMSIQLERMRQQQVHVDEIKRLCHVPIIV